MAAATTTPFSDRRSTPDLPYPPTGAHPVAGPLDETCAEEAHLKLEVFLDWVPHAGCSVALDARG